MSHVHQRSVQSDQTVRATFLTVPAPHVQGLSLARRLYGPHSCCISPPCQQGPKDIPVLYHLFKDENLKQLVGQLDVHTLADLLSLCQYRLYKHGRYIQEGIARNWCRWLQRFKLTPAF